MTIELNIQQLLSLMDRPAFYVTEGIVREVNPAAAARMIQPGDSITGLLHSGHGDYEAFSEGCLHLTLKLGSILCSASVTRLGNGDLFTLEQEENETALRCYSLAARVLRQPLGQMMDVAERLFPSMTGECGEDAAQQMARMNRAMHHMLRLVGNMSDAGGIGQVRMELRDITAVVQEILDHTQPLCASAGFTLFFENHPAAVYTMLDYQRLERALLNLLSNAMKHTAPGGTIAVRLKRRSNTVYLTVENPDSHSGAVLTHGMTTRYLREPILEDGENGLGLGLPMVQAIAAAHYGTLLVEQPKAGGFRATMSLPIRQNTGILRSPTVRFDYAGERDHGLIELSESLPPECYLPNKL